MRVLVTGAGGRVGSRLVPRLAARDQVRAMVRDPDRAAALWNAGLDVIEGDLRDPETLKRAAVGQDAVVHLAAVDLDTTVELARACLAAGVERFVFPSTGLVYGPGRGRPARESDEPHPSERYQQSKVATERALAQLHREAGLGLRVLRFGFVYGEGDPHLAETVGLAAPRPAHWRLHLVHHADVAQGVGLALRASDVDGGVFNLADEVPVAGWELAALGGAPPSTMEGESDPWEGILDTARIAALGFRPRYPSVHSAAAAGAL
jgi:nucleoside-diphosphate-sugar epimerase